MTTLFSILIFLAILIVGLGVPGLMIKALFDWQALLLMAAFRRKRVVMRGAGVFFAAWLGGAFLIEGVNSLRDTGVNGALTGFPFAFFFSPWLAKWWVLRSTWNEETDAEVRKRRAGIRNRLLEREGSRRRVSEDKLWPEYILDAEWAAREDEYRLPGMSENVRPAAPVSHYD